MSPINDFLVSNMLWIKNNPCISPDFCLDWENMKVNLSAEEKIDKHINSRFDTKHGDWSIVEDSRGDHAWCLSPNQSSSAKEAEILFEAGRLSKIDLLNFKSSKMNSENDLFDVGNEIDNLMLKLSNLLDMDIKSNEIQLDYDFVISESLIKKKQLSDLMNSSYGKYLSFMEKLTCQR